MSAQDNEALETRVHTLLNRFRGRLCGHIEAMELPERKERSLISVFKSMTYDLEADIVRALWSES